MTTIGLRQLAATTAGALLLTATWAVGAMAAPGGSAAPAAAAAKDAPATSIKATTDSQREAAAVLERMARYLAGLQTFAFDMRAGYDAVQSSGQKIEFGETRHVIVARPGRLRVEEISSSGAHDLAIFDGKTLTAFDADQNVYAQAPQPPALDDALVYFVRDLRMRMPLAWLMTTRLPGELPQRVTAIDYVEETDALGAPAHHVAGRGDGVDFQVWISTGERPLPMRIVLTYVSAPGQPQYWANTANWTTTPKLTDATFRFKAPADARRIDFAVQMRPAPGGPPAPASAGGVTP